jgi:hypothetical protein
MLPVYTLQQKNFVAEAALLKMGGSFLPAFFKGVAKKAGDVAQEKMGDSLGTAPCNS